MALRHFPFAEHHRDKSAPRRPCHACEDQQELRRPRRTRRRGKRRRLPQATSRSGGTRSGGGRGGHTATLTNVLTSHGEPSGRGLTWASNRRQPWPRAVGRQDGQEGAARRSSSTPITCAAHEERARPCGKARRAGESAAPGEEETARTRRGARRTRKERDAQEGKGGAREGGAAHAERSAAHEKRGYARGEERDTREERDGCLRGETAGKEGGAHAERRRRTRGAAHEKGRAARGEEGRHANPPAALRRAGARSVLASGQFCQYPGHDGSIRGSVWFRSISPTLDHSPYATRTRI